MNTAALNTVYNHYLTSYAPKGTTPYDLHKKSELRKIYNTIVKLNKDTPLYKLDTGAVSQAFAVGIKESARELNHTIASLGGLNEDEMLNQKIAFSSNDNIASAKFVGSSPVSADPPPYELEVKSLALPQTNTGHYLPADDMALNPGTYSFDLNIADTNYEFQFTVNEKDTNIVLQEKLAKLITNSGIGVTAYTIGDDAGNHALRLESTSTGRPKANRDSLFLVTDNRTSKTAGAVDYLGIGEITRKSADSSIVLNGETQNTPSNHFVIDETYAVTLNGISPDLGEVTNIGLKTDVDSLTENIHLLVGGYNDFLRAAAEYRGAQTKADTLIFELKRISSFYSSHLDLLGLLPDKNGYISINDNQLSESAMEEDAKERFAPVKDFTQSILQKTEQVTLNPMNYVNKTVILYKNPGKSFPCPYMTSAYSGMMFNSYV